MYATFIFIQTVLFAVTNDDKYLEPFVFLVTNRDLT